MADHPARAAVLFWLGPWPVTLPLGVIGLLEQRIPIAGLAFVLAIGVIEWGLLLWLGWRLWVRPTRRLLGVLVVVVIALQANAVAHGQVVWWRLLLDAAVLICCVLAWNHPQVVRRASDQVDEPAPAATPLN